MTRFLTLFAALIAIALGTPAFAAGGGGESGGGKKVTASESWLPLEPLTASVAQGYRVDGVLQIDAGLEIADTRLRQKAYDMQPRLRDAYIGALADYCGRFYRPGEVPDAGAIGDMLQAATDRTLGEPGAEFLLGMVVIH